MTMHVTQLEGEAVSRNPFSLEAFLEYCKSRPRDEYYEFTSTGACACGQYSRIVGERNWTSFGSENHKFWVGANRLASGFEMAAAVPSLEERQTLWTFGALVERLQEHISKEKTE